MLMFLLYPSYSAFLPGCPAMVGYSFSFAFSGVPRSRICSFPT